MLQLSYHDSGLNSGLSSNLCGFLLSSGATPKVLRVFVSALMDMASAKADGIEIENEQAMVEERTAAENLGRKTP